MSDYSHDELRSIQMQAADARRLQNDPALWPCLRAIKAQATNAMTYGPDARDREQSRMLVVAIDMLSAELENRVQSAISLADARDRARAFE